MSATGYMAHGIHAWVTATGPGTTAHEMLRLRPKLAVKKMYPLGLLSFGLPEVPSHIQSESLFNQSRRRDDRSGWQAATNVVSMMVVGHKVADNQAFKRY